MMYCVMLHGLLLCCCCCDCVFPLHVLVRFVFCFCVLFYRVCFALCFVVLGCVLFFKAVCVSRLCFFARRCMRCLCVRFVSVVCFTCLCVIGVLYCVMLSGVFVCASCVNMCA